MPKIIKASWVLQHLMDHAVNFPIPKDTICSCLGIGKRTLRRKIAELLDDDEDLCLLCCVYHTIIEGRSRFAGGYMIYDPQTASDETEEIVRETYNWFLATGKAFTRIGAKMLDKKPLTALIPARQKKAIEKVSKKYQEYLDNDYDSVFQYGAEA